MALAAQIMVGLEWERNTKSAVQGMLDDNYTVRIALQVMQDAISCVRTHMLRAERMKVARTASCARAYYLYKVDSILGSCYPSQLPVLILDATKVQTILPRAISNPVYPGSPQCRLKCVLDK